MESKTDLDEENTSENKSPDTPNPDNVQSDGKEDYNFGNQDGKGRKRKIEWEILEIEDVSSERTLAVKRENNSVCSDRDQNSELYGLKLEFLESLEIKPPLSKWVYVTNFRCDKTELKEVFELAGHIVICSVIAVKNRYANMMFSHPLEAVQAVSMFNGQIFYGMKLKVTMIKPPSDTVVLPKGLKDIGPGLGFNGRPLRDIVKHYKRYTKHQLSLVDASLFSRQSDEQDKDILDSDKNKFTDKNGVPGLNGDLANRPKYFKITRVEDLSTDSASTVQDTGALETEFKKPKRPDTIEVISSDEENTDVKIVRTFPAKVKEEKTIPKGNETELKDSRHDGDFIRTSGIHTIPAAAAYGNRGTHNPVPMPTAQLNQGESIGYPGPSGSLAPPGPMAPFPLPGLARPPVVSTVLMMGSGGPMGPMAPVRAGSMGPFGPPVGPIGAPRVMGPTGSFGPGNYGPRGPPNLQGPNQGFPPHPMRGNGPNQPTPGPFTLQFRNLPPSTTFPLLSDRLAQCGQVMSLQLTTPGCAIARFAQRAHAERCFQMFNGKCIDGCVIEVRFARVEMTSE